MPNMMMGLGKLTTIILLMIWKLSTLYTSTGVTVVILLNAPKSLAATPPLPVSNNNSSLPLITNSTSDVDGKNLHCIDLADFFYDIILALSSFPTATCTRKEEKEISHFFTQKINQVLKNTPGTLQTKNKICNKAINSRRRLINYQDVKKDKFNENYSQLFHSEPTDHRKLVLRANRRSFIYVGGGRCRFCFFDDLDYRQRQLALFNHNKRNEKHRLLPKVAPVVDDDDGHGPVADASLCNAWSVNYIHNSDTEKKFDSWKGVNVDTFTGSNKAKEDNELLHFLGPFVAGDSFSRTFDLAPLVAPNHKKDAPGKKNKSAVNSSVTGVSIKFSLRAFDIPDKYIKTFMDDEPVLVFVNGIKFDFNMMMNAPSARKRSVHVGKDAWMNDDDKDLESRDVNAAAGSFVGVQWNVRDSYRIDNIGYGPQKDRTYRFSFNLPPVFFSAHGKIDVQYMIKPEAKAKFYGFDHLVIDVDEADCEITGLETSPFDDFKRVMEIRLREQLGVGLLDKFQSRKGHCLENKIPVVDVHLVEKEKWKDANPRCNTA